MTPVKYVVGPKQSDNQKFGALLEKLRRNAKLSRAQAALKLGLSSEYVRLFEKGSRAPVLGSIRKICEIYGASCEISNINSCFIVYDDERIEVVFTSRIREERRKGEELLTPKLRRSGTKRRAKQIGYIVEMLIQADDQTLDQIYHTLTRN